MFLRTGDLTFTLTLSIDLLAVKDLAFDLFVLDKTISVTFHVNNRIHHNECLHDNPQLDNTDMEN